MKLKESKTNIGVYLAIVILFGLLVAGCGAKGKLYLPEEEEAKQQQSQKKEEQKKKKADTASGDETEAEVEAATESTIDSTIDNTTDITNE